MLQIIIFLALLGLGFGIGKHLERKHFLSILQRERDLSHIVAFSAKRPPDTFRNQFLVQGSVVVSSDYFKQFLSGWRLFFGGRLKSYETLLERARREAVLRMKAEAQAGNANAIFNVKLETSVISDQNSGGGAIGTVEILAYGTAGVLSQ
ncbi:MAG: YbjQ family protein [Neisseriaceae bacterium]|nr:YbjQ family protein [Neisseriaceae bacterium]MBP5790317.1 YbjQ family protein [Neisseriaceae bacterium]